MVLASGSSSTAPETEAANFLSGKSIRASWGLKAPAQMDRISALFEDLEDRDGGRVGEEGIKPISRREVRYWVRFE